MNVVNEKWQNDRPADESIESLHKSNDDMPMRKLRIGINGRFLVAKQTGVQRAAYNLLLHLLRLDDRNTYVIFTGEDQAQNSDWQRPNVELVLSGVKSGENLRNHFWEQFMLPFLAKRARVDILHCPANLAPILYSGKSIVNIHDLCFIVNPHWYRFSFRNLYNFLIPKIARSSSRVITNSNNSRNDIYQFCGVSADSVSLVYWAVDESFLNPEQTTEAMSLPSDDYILYVGSVEPRKNIINLVQAYEKFRDSHPDYKTKLYLIGSANPLFASVKLHAPKYRHDVHLLGYLEDSHLRYCYRHARCVVYPSFYEGFGLPPLEAMACGAPVITSCTSSIPEVVGDAAMLINPFDVSQIAEAIYTVLSQPAVADALRKKGRTQVQQFNWYRVARNTLAVYYEVAGIVGNNNIKGREISEKMWNSWRQMEQKYTEKLFGI